MEILLGVDRHRTHTQSSAKKQIAKISERTQKGLSDFLDILHAVTH